MKNIEIFFLLILGVCLGACGEYVSFDGGKSKVWGGYAEAKMTVQVVDQDGVPVVGAVVKAGLFNSKYKNTRQPFNGLTNTNGIYTIEGSTIKDVTYSIEKEGYYYTRGRYDFRDSAPSGEQAVVNGKWQPWNSVQKVVLKKEKTPIPMYVKKVVTTCPEQGCPVGYDLIIGDWVAPYGKGETTDILFTVTGEMASLSDRSASMKVEFPNKFDGIQEFTVDADQSGGMSRFVSSYFSPAGNYEGYWTFEMKFAPELENRVNIVPSENSNFFLRVRTEVDENKKIMSALYGKIYGDLRCDFRDPAKPDDIGVYFTYYLNPTPNDRNIEFDPEQNLLGGRDRFAP